MGNQGNPKARRKAFELRAAGQSQSEIARTVGVNKSTVSRWFTEEDRAASSRPTDRANDVHPLVRVVEETRAAIAFCLACESDDWERALERFFASRRAQGRGELNHGAFGIVIGKLVREIAEKEESTVVDVLSRLDAEQAAILDPGEVA